MAIAQRGANTKTRHGIPEGHRGGPLGREANGSEANRVQDGMKKKQRKQRKSQVLFPCFGFAKRETESQVGNA